MNAYIKNSELIINNNVDSLYKEDLLEFIEKSKNSNLESIPLYGLDGKVNGIKIKIK